MIAADRSEFGHDDATAGYSKFLGCFMPRKVMCGVRPRKLLAPS